MARPNPPPPPRPANPARKLFNDFIPFDQKTTPLPPGVKPTAKQTRHLPDVKVLVTTDLGSRGVDTLAVKACRVVRRTAYDDRFCSSAGQDGADESQGEGDCIDGGQGSEGCDSGGEGGDVQGPGSDLRDSKT